MASKQQEQLDPALAQRTVTLGEVAALATSLGPLSKERVLEWVKEKSRATR